MQDLVVSALQLAQAHPEVFAVGVFVMALGTHITVGALLHLVRLRDFDWRKLGRFVEQDMATTRGVAILVTLLLTLSTTIVPGSDWHAAFGPAFATLVASCAAATLPIVRDTLYELVQLLTGTNPRPAPRPAR